MISPMLTAYPRRRSLPGAKVDLEVVDLEVAEAVEDSEAAVEAVEGELVAGKSFLALK